MKNKECSKQNLLPYLQIKVLTLFVLKLYMLTRKWTESKCTILVKKEKKQKTKNKTKKEKKLIAKMISIPECF